LAAFEAEALNVLKGSLSIARIQSPNPYKAGIDNLRLIWITAGTM
jgi:hypothetical protein